MTDDGLVIELVARPPVPAAPGYVRNAAEIRMRGERRELWLMTPADARPTSSDWLIPPGLLLGMARGEPVRVRGRVSPRLFGSLDEIQRMLLAHPEPDHPLTAVAVEADEVAVSPPISSGETLSTFSAGLDSFYTALELGPRLDSLLYVHGYEARLGDEAQLLVLLPGVRFGAEGMGKRLRLAEGNFGKVVWRRSGRTMYTAFPMLVMLALAMGSRVTRLALPASYDAQYERDDWASLSRFAPLWSTESLAVFQHGAITRLEKLRTVARSAVAMRCLRVCWNVRGVHYNCGRCSKCVRTMVDLELTGNGGRCSTLPARIDLRRVAALHPQFADQSQYAEASLAEAEAQGRDDLAQALRASLAHPRSPAPWTWPARRVRKAAARLVRSARRRLAERALVLHRRRHPGAHLFNSVAPVTVREGHRS